MQVAEQLHSPGPMRSPHALSLREHRLVDECDTRAASGEHEGGDAPGGALSSATSTSNRSSVIRLFPCRPALYGHVRGGPRAGNGSRPNRFAQDLFRQLPHHYDFLEELLSLGQNGRWRREMIAHIDRAPRSVLDVATGTGGVALRADRAGPRSRHHRYRHHRSHAPTWARARRAGGRLVSL